MVTGGARTARGGTIPATSAGRPVTRPPRPARGRPQQPAHPPHPRLLARAPRGNVRFYEGPVPRARVHGLRLGVPATRPDRHSERSSGSPGSRCLAAAMLAAMYAALQHDERRYDFSPRSRSGRRLDDGDREPGQRDTGRRGTAASVGTPAVAGRPRRLMEQAPPPAATPRWSTRTRWMPLTVARRALAIR